MVKLPEQSFATSCKCQATTIEQLSNGIIKVQKQQSHLDLAYFQLYSQIAEADLLESLQTKRILNNSAARDLELIGNVEGKSVLEIGPGLGALSKLLRISGAQVTVADLIPNYLLPLRADGFECLQVDAQNLSLYESFDVIVLCDVLEHVFRPYDVLHSAHVALKKNGLIYVRSPIRESLKNYSLLLGYPYEIVHLRTYTSDLLKRELHSSGFKIKQISRNLATANRQIRNFPVLTRIVLNYSISQNLASHYSNVWRQRFFNFIAGSDIDLEKTKIRKIFKPLIKIFRLLLMSPGEIAIIAKK